MLAKRGEQTGQRKGWKRTMNRMEYSASNSYERFSNDIHPVTPERENEIKYARTIYV